MTSHLHWKEFRQNACENPPPVSDHGRRRLKLHAGVPHRKRWGRRGEEGGSVGCGVGLAGLSVGKVVACIRRCRSDILIRKTLFRAHGFVRLLGWEVCLMRRVKLRGRVVGLAVSWGFEYLDG